MYMDNWLSTMVPRQANEENKVLSQVMLGKSEEHTRTANWRPTIGQSTDLNNHTGESPQNWGQDYLGERKSTNSTEAFRV